MFTALKSCHVIMLLKFRLFSFLSRNKPKSTVSITSSHGLTFCMWQVASRCVATWFILWWVRLCRRDHKPRWIQTVEAGWWQAVLSWPAARPLLVTSWLGWSWLLSEEVNSTHWLGDMLTANPKFSELSFELLYTKISVIFRPCGWINVKSTGTIRSGRKTWKSGIMELFSNHFDFWSISAIFNSANSQYSATLLISTGI